MFPVPKEEAGAHVCSGCVPGSPPGDWCEGPPPCCPSWRWHASSSGTEESEWELDELLSTPERLCTRPGTCLTRHHKPVVPRKPLPTQRGKRPLLPFGNSRLPPYSTPLRRKLGSRHTKRAQKQVPATMCPISESVDPSSEESAKEGLSRGASALGTRSEWASMAPRAGSAPCPPWSCTVSVREGSLGENAYFQRPRGQLCASASMQSVPSVRE